MTISIKMKDGHEAVFEGDGIGYDLRRDILVIWDSGKKENWRGVYARDMLMMMEVDDGN